MVGSGGLTGVDGPGLEPGLVGAGDAGPLAHLPDPDEEVQQVAAGDDPDGMAAVEHEHGAVLCQAGRGHLNRFAVPTIGIGGAMTESTASVEGFGCADEPGEEVAVGHRAHHLGQGQRRLGLDHRHLRDAVLAQDRDGLADGLVRDGRGPAAGATGSVRSLWASNSLDRLCGRPPERRNPWSAIQPSS